ncbi:MAG: hypothetical protein CK532_03520 [Flavobacteriales bacterium]|nr:MAG: hypothetical protein CK532_03520 [Flavobacteriales bacterium]
MMFASLTIALGSFFAEPYNVKPHIDSNEFRTIRFGADFGASLLFSGSSPNWSSGGSNNINGNGFMIAFAQIKKPNTSFDNILKVNIGWLSSRQIDNFNVKYRVNKKTLDNVFLDSKFGHTINAEPGMSIFGGLNFQTQLLDGYTYSRNSVGRELAVLNSGFLSQGQTQFALGIEYKPMPSFYCRLGCLTLKQTYMINQLLYSIRNEQIIARVKKEQYFDNQLGVQFQLGSQRDFGITKQVSMKINYLGFAPYVSDEASLDSRIDFSLITKITKHINLNYTLIGIYDKDLVKSGASAWQNSWLFGLGYIHSL